MLLHLKTRGKKNSTPYRLAGYNTILAMYSVQGDEEGFEKLLKEISVSKLEPPRTAPAMWFRKKLTCGHHMSARRDAAGMFWSIRKICMLTVV